jgi:carbohydrate-binding DOMON domain-containing protein
MLDPRRITLVWPVALIFGLAALVNAVPPALDVVMIYVGPGAQPQRTGASKQTRTATRTHTRARIHTHTVTQAVIHTRTHKVKAHTRTHSLTHTHTLTHT